MLFWSFWRPWRLNFQLRFRRFPSGSLVKCQLRRWCPWRCWPSWRCSGVRSCSRGRKASRNRTRERQERWERCRRWSESAGSSSSPTRSERSNKGGLSSANNPPAEYSVFIRYKNKWDYLRNCSSSEVFRSPSWLLWPIHTFGSVADLLAVQ